MIAFVAALTALALSIFIVVPGPTPGLFALSVGVTELWPLVALLDLAAFAAALCIRRRALRVASILCALLGLALSFVPLASYLAKGPRVPLHVLLLPAPPNAAVTVTAFAAPNVLLYRLPPARLARPIAIVIYGGAWQRGSPANDAEFNRELAAAGFCVVAINYRHAPGARWPAARTDAIAALEWVQRHATAFGGDPRRISLLGHSSGAQIAFSVAAARPQAVASLVLYESPVDLRLGYLFPVKPDIIHARDVMSALCGGPPAAAKACYRDASPRYEVRRGMPPVLMVVAGRDHVVNLDYEGILRDELRRDGSAVTYLELPWADHAFETLAYGWHNRIAMWYVLRFLRATDHPKT